MLLHWVSFLLSRQPPEPDLFDCVMSLKAQSAEQNLHLYHVDLTYKAEILKPACGEADWLIYLKVRKWRDELT